MPITVPASTAPLRPADEPPRRRLVVFPHAGAGPASYRALLAPLATDVEVIGVTLPGRERRAQEPPTAALPELLATTARDIAALEPLPTVYFGHSMGSLLAVRLAHAHPAGVDGLIVSAGLPGGRAHHAPERLAGRHGLSELLVRHRLPSWSLEAPHRLTAAQRLLVHDLSLTRAILTSMAGIRLRVPITALAGQDDRIVPAATLPLWRSFTSAAFRTREVSGGHYFPFVPVGRRVVLTEIHRSLTAAERRRRSLPVRGGQQVAGACQ